MILALIGMIPGLMNLINGFQTAYFDAKVRIYMARTGAERDVAVAAVQAIALADHETTARLSIIASNKVLLTILVLLIAPVIFFEWQVILVDKLWCGYWHLECSTDPITGQVADWANVIIASVTGSGTALGVAKVFANFSQSSGKE